jgi:hypothetical protein
MNGYNQTKFQQAIKTSRHWPVIQKLIDQQFQISYACTYDSKIFTEHLVTPREYYYYPRLTVCSLYYIDYLNEIKPQQIIDIGCGMNVWKQFYPNIYGIDAAHPNADHMAIFDDNYSQINTNAIEAAFTIGGLTFTSLINLQRQMLSFINIIALGGRGYMSFNLGRMLTHYTNKDDYQKIFDKTSPSTEEISMYCDSIITKLPVKLLVVDNLILERYNDYMDGNLRIVFEKS